MLDHVVRWHPPAVLAALAVVGVAAPAVPLGDCSGLGSTTLAFAAVVAQVAAPCDRRLILPPLEPLRLPPVPTVVEQI